MATGRAEGLGSGPGGRAEETREGLVYSISAKHRMNSSAAKYISVSSPRTRNLSQSPFPQSLPVQPGFHPADWKRPSVNQGGFAPRPHDSQESDSESLVQERWYQSELQQRIRENEELVGLYSDELENDSLEEDSLEEGSLKEQEGAECNTSGYAKGMQKNDGHERKPQPVDKYFNLRYNPHWKNTKEVADFSVAEKACQGAGGRSLDFSEDSFYLHSSGSPEEKNQEEAKPQDSFSEFGTELLSFHEPHAVVSNEPFRLHTKGKGSAGACHFRDGPSTRGSAFSLRIQKDRPQRANKDFVEKNKQTLGLRSEKRNSYLQLHSKKQEILQEQGADPRTVDEEAVQSVLPLQTVKTDPEDKWYLKLQQLKDHQKKPFQRNKIKSKQSIQGRAFTRTNSQQPPAEPQPWHHQIPTFQPALMQAEEQDKSSTVQKRLYQKLSADPDPNTAANSDTCLNNFPNSSHCVNQDFTTAMYPCHPTLHKFNPVEEASLTVANKESKKYQRGSPKGLPRDQRHSYNRATVFPGGDSQAPPNQRTVPSAFNAKFQEVVVKNQVSLQDCERHLYVDQRYQNYASSCLWLSQSSVHTSPAAPCTTSQFTQAMERRPQEITPLREAHLAGRQLFSLLPPVIPQVECGLEVDPESREGNGVKICRSNSAGYLMQTEKQNQPKVSKKPCSSKAYINLNVKLGGLGPDYEAVKEKKEKLKQQKEYAKQIKEHNMRNIASVQRFPTKPQVMSSVSRQKALEYAKKIPKPKTFAARQTDEEAKEERVLPQTLKGDSLPQIASLETLQHRHEKEKQVVAAFRTLHIL